MISRFDNDTALLIVDAQLGINVLNYWGGAKGHRNNPHAEDRIAELLSAWRKHQMPVFYTVHDSRESKSPLKLNLETGQIFPELLPIDGEVIVRKDVNSGFIGTNLEIQLRRSGISRLVVAGFFTNMCIETTVRMAGNLGFDSYLVDDACACTNRIRLDGTDIDPDMVHSMTLANLHGEFCTVLNVHQTIGLLESNAEELKRMMGNE